jgi:deoxyadenosine/deoxycytidine kinase
MVKIISFEGCVGAGKTSLTNYFSHELKVGKILEEYESNPFLKKFYEGDSNINLENEITFLMIHFSQLKKAIKNCDDDFLITDFTIEKDLVYAKLNLNEEDLRIFEDMYNYVIKQVGIPHIVLYIDLSLKILKRRIFQRGRSYELNAEPEYFKQYNDKVKEYFKNEAKSKTYFFDVDDLDLDPDNRKLSQIRDKILEQGINL